MPCASGSGHERGAVGDCASSGSARAGGGALPGGSPAGQCFSVRVPPPLDAVKWPDEEPLPLPRHRLPGAWHNPHQCFPPNVKPSCRLLPPATSQHPPGRHVSFSSVVDIHNFEGARSGTPRSWGRQGASRPVRHPGMDDTHQRSWDSLPKGVDSTLWALAWAIRSANEMARSCGRRNVAQCPLFSLAVQSGFGVSDT